MRVDWYHAAAMLAFVASIVFTIFLLWAAVSLFILAFSR